MKTSSHYQNRAGKRLSLALATILSLPTLALTQALADKVQLSDNHWLTGSLLELDKDTVTLKAAMAERPLQIKATSIKSITFPAREDTSQPIVHTEKVTLANNDCLPCQIISMDENHVLITTTYAGKFNIRRSDISSLQFGVQSEQTVFVGNQDPAHWDSVEGEWQRPNPAQNLYQGTGSLAQEIDLPENLRIKFKLGWHEGKHPNFVLRFCSEGNSAITKQNTYELSFNTAGMQIRRYLSDTQPSVIIANIPSIRPSLYKDNTASIDLQVNRQDGELSLSINSEHIATWPDPFSAPTGKHIIFNNRSKEQNSCMISDITVTTLSENVLPRYHADKPALTETDLLIDSEGERISGNLVTITADASGKRSVGIKTKFAPAELIIPDHRISSLCFARSGQSPSYPASPFIIELAEKGRLQLENPKFADGNIAFSHPILGLCELTSSYITRIKRMDPQAGEKKEN